MKKKRFLKVLSLLLKIFKFINYLYVIILNLKKRNKMSLEKMIRIAKGEVDEKGSISLKLPMYLKEQLVQVSSIFNLLNL